MSRRRRITLGGAVVAVAGAVAIGVASPGRSVEGAGYEVEWRESTEPLWTHARAVGNVTDATIAGLNKDDVQVGVRAIDKDGNRSPVAYPVPATQ